MVEGDKLAAAHRVPKLLAVMPILQEEIIKMLDQVDSKAYWEMDRGEFDETIAYALWVEKRSIVRLLKRLEQVLAQGTAAGEEIAAQM